MLVAISGSQGSGKSTILKMLREDGARTIERKTSRSILTDWGVTLQDVNNDPDLTTRFQEEITNRKYNDEIGAIRDSVLWYTERTHADLFTYALVSLGKDNAYSSWLNDYYKKCMLYNQLYASVFYLRAGHFSIEHDGTRGSNVHYSRMVDLTMMDMTQQMVRPGRLNVIDTPDLDQRMSIIKSQSEIGLRPVEVQDL